MDLIYDLKWKEDSMKYFLIELIKRRGWSLYPFSGSAPPIQNGVKINGGLVEIDGSAKIRWSHEAIYYTEAYISTVQSFFDILAKAFSKNWVSGQDLYFKSWIDKEFKNNQQDNFLKTLHDFKNKWVEPISKIRNPSVHERSLARNIPTFVHVGWKKGQGFDTKFLIFKQNGSDVELVDYLESFDREFD